MKAQKSSSPIFNRGYHGKVVGSILACLACCLIHAVPATGAVVVSIESKSISAGGAGFVDVLIEVTGGDNVAVASYDFLITNVGAPSSTLKFTGLEGDALSNYVFDGKDFFGQDLITLVDDQLIGTDALDLDPGATGSNPLLARLNLENVFGVGGATGAVGDQFRITLQDSGDTLFQDDGFSDLTIDDTSIDPFVDGGLITISAASAVSEPGSLAILGFATVYLGCRRKLRKRLCRCV